MSEQQKRGVRGGWVVEGGFQQQQKERKKRKRKKEKKERRGSEYNRLVQRMSLHFSSKWYLRALESLHVLPPVSYELNLSIGVVKVLCEYKCFLAPGDVKLNKTLKPWQPERAVLSEQHFTSVRFSST